MIKETLDIYYGRGINKHLSNLNGRPFKGNDNRKYISVEHAYQSWKSGEFDPDIYNNANWAPGRKIASKLKPKKDFTLWLMERLIYLSFKQNPSQCKQLLDTYPLTLTHVHEKGFWGSEFPRLLMEVRTTLMLEDP